MTKLTRSDYRFVERLLYEQKTHETAIVELQAELDELIDPCSTSIIEFSPSGGECSSHTENSVIKRMDSVRGKTIQDEIRIRKRHQKAISEAISKLSDTEAQLVWLKYNLEKSYRECMQIMGYEKSHFYRIKGDVVCKVGRFLGL